MTLERATLLEHFAQAVLYDEGQVTSPVPAVRAPTVAERSEAHGYRVLLIR
jgi:hypothetical protein